MTYTGQREPGFRAAPTPRRKRHIVRNILAGIGTVVVTVVVIAAVSHRSSGVTTTPSSASSSAAPATASSTASSAPAARQAVVGSSFVVADASGDNYRVTLVRIISPATGSDEFNQPDNGKHFVAAVFTIAAITGSPQNEDANNDAALVGSDGQTYTPTFYSVNGWTNFDSGQINVAQGDTTTGAVVFEVPDGVKTRAVQWSPATFGTPVQWLNRRQRAS